MHQAKFSFTSGRPLHRASQPKRVVSRKNRQLDWLVQTLGYSCEVRLAKTQTLIDGTLTIILGIIKNSLRYPLRIAPDARYKRPTRAFFDPPALAPHGAQRYSASFDFCSSSSLCSLAASVLLPVVAVDFDDIIIGLDSVIILYLGDAEDSGYRWTERLLAVGRWSYPGVGVGAGVAGNTQTAEATQARSRVPLYGMWTLGTVPLKVSLVSRSSSLSMKCGRFPASWTAPR